MKIQNNTIDHNAIIQEVIARNRKTFIQSSIDFNKASKVSSIVNEPVLSTQERLKLQRQVVLSDIKLCCLEDVKSTLPYLLPHQHEDVVKAERWLWELGNKGMLFTNSTGSGKSILGAGIIFRHQGNVLLIVPSNKKCLDWQEELRFLNLRGHILESIKDKGKQGINITTYANFRQNTSLQQRRWDIVIYDECHNIMSNEQGKETFCLQAHRKTTHHHTFIRDNAETFVAGRRPTKETEVYEYNKRVNRLYVEIDEEVERLKVMTKVIFLSATPFPYIENLEYADGYLFEMGSDKRIEDLPSDRDLFFMDNFGYGFDKGKLIRPETGVDVNKMEREFADKMLSSGAMSTRKIQLDYDYSREFILI